MVLNTDETHRQLRVLTEIMSDKEVYWFHLMYQVVK